MSIDFGAFDGALSDLGAARQAINRARYRALYRMGALVKDTAVKYAPKSPTQAEKDKNAAKKVMRKAIDAGADFKTALNAAKSYIKKIKAKRSEQSSGNARSTSRTAPGGLMRSIQFKSNEDNAEIFVAANSEAGRYAFAIHELKGRTWQKRGPGTIAKGAHADDKFITRAMTDKDADMQRIAESELNKAIDKLNR